MALKEGPNLVDLWYEIHAWTLNVFGSVEQCSADLPIHHLMQAVYDLQKYPKDSSQNKYRIAKIMSLAMDAAMRMGLSHGHLADQMKTNLTKDQRLWKPRDVGSAITPYRQTASNLQSYAWCHSCDFCCDGDPVSVSKSVEDHAITMWGHAVSRTTWNVPYDYTLAEQNALREENKPKHHQKNG